MRLTLFAMISTLLLSSCQTKPVASPDVMDNDFQVQALTHPYLSRKIERWLSTNQGARLLRELQYAQTKHPTLMQQVVSNAANPPAFYDSIRNNTTVATYSGSNGTFNTFLQTLAPTQASCKGYYDRNATGDRISGTKTIDLDGSGPIAPISVYCDQVNDGGGWTMIAAQYEADPVAWNEGIQSDYDPTLVTKKSFALSSTQLPTHTHTAFGKDTNATFVDYVPYVYTTGNLPGSAQLTSPRAPNKKYHIHRDTTYHYGSHDVVEGSTSVPQSDQNWNNTLSFDQTGGIMYSWSFSPIQSPASNRGYAMQGTALFSNAQSYAWTVWVR